MKMLIALLSASLVSACSLDRLTGTKPKAAYPQCVRGSVTFTPETTYVQTSPTTLTIQIVYTAHVCGEPKGYPG